MNNTMQIRFKLLCHTLHWLNKQQGELVVAYRPPDTSGCPPVGCPPTTAFHPPADTTQVR